MFSKLLATTLVGFASAEPLQSTAGPTPKPEDPLDIFANNMLDHFNDPVVPPKVDFHEDFKKIEALKASGELDDSDAFKSMCQLA